MQFLKSYRNYSHQIYLGLLILLAVSLPFSPFLMSLSQILLIINWILEGNFHQKFFRLKYRKSILIFTAIYLMQLLWLAGTDYWDGAAEDLRIKLPLLILPIIIGTSNDISPNEMFRLLKFYVAAIFLATIVSMLVYFGVIPHPVTDIRHISIFISHIRFSLMIVVAILVLMHWIKTSEGFFTRKQLGLVTLITWFILFLFFMKALTGVVVLAVAMFFLLILLINKIENQILKVALIVLIYAIPFYSIMTVIKAYNQYYHSLTKIPEKLPEYTANGNKYFHDLSSWQKENGNKVWLFVCETELRKEWNKRSKYPYDSLDKKGQPIRSTLIRYLTSKSLTKDSAGITKLTGRDIVNIENGMTNIIFEKKYSIMPRIYEVFYEIDHYKHSGAVDNHSVMQRLVYYQIAIYLIKKHFWFGVGTGDLKKEYLNYYQTHDTGLSPERWWQTHNQFLRIFATFGIIGFIIFLAAFILPPYFERKYNSYYFLMIFIIVLLSFINEDTLETQAGVTFSTYFYSLFLWGASRKLL